MVGRHPHVFGDVVADTADEVVANWETWKAAEKPDRESPFDGLPKGLPALAFADKVIGKLRDEPAKSELVGPITTEETLGELLLALVASARANGLDAERALRVAVRRVIAENDDR